MTLDNQEIPMSSHFKYLGSIIQMVGELNSDVSHKIQAGWLKWKSAIGILCDHNILLWLKEKFYRTAIRPALFMAQMLGYKEILCPEDECSRDVHTLLDVW